MFVHLLFYTVLHVAYVTSEKLALPSAILLYVDTMPEFPHLYTKPFNIRLMPGRPLPEMLSANSFDSIVFQITDDSKKVLEKATFIYGVKNVGHKPFDGNYIKIRSWKVNNVERFITFNVEFKKRSNKMFLHIFQILASSYKIQKDKMRSLESQYLVIQKKIDLMIPPQLKLSMPSIDGEKNTVMDNKAVFVTCRSFGGVPNLIPSFANLKNFISKNNSISKSKNEVYSEFTFTKYDHLAKLICKAGPSEEFVEIKVIYAPTRVRITPEVGNKVGIGNKLLCNPENGYPTPQTSWAFVNASINNAQQYFLINEDRTRLRFLTNVPQDSQWTFSCSAENKFTRLNSVVKRTLNLKIKGNFFTIFEVRRDNVDPPPRLSEFEGYIDAQIRMIKREIVGSKRLIQTLQEEMKIVRSEIRIVNQTKKKGEEEEENSKLDEFKTKLEEQDRKVSDLMNNIDKKVQNFEIISEEVQKLKQEKQTGSSSIDNLKKQLESFNKDLQLNNRIVSQMTSNMHTLSESSTSLEAQMKFVKQHLYWIDPIVWTVHSITLGIFENKREASSDPFYSSKKRYKMTLYFTITKELIQYYLFLPNVARNKENGWPFRAQVTITVFHKTFSTITTELTKDVVINASPSISEPFNFDHKELLKAGYLADNAITIQLGIAEP